MTQVLDFARLATNRPREAILEALQDRADYAWVSLALDDATDGLFLQRLDKAPSIEDTIVASAQRFPGRYNPAYLGDNLAAAANLLGQATLKRTEIQGLESQGTSLALQYLLEENQRADQFKIARLHALHAASGAQVDPKEYLAALDRQEKVQADTFAVRLKLHNAPASALNFSERIHRLRDLYCLELLEAWARMKAANLAMRFVVEAPPGLKWPSLPDVDGSAGDLNRMTAWVKNASYTFDALSHRETEQVLAVDLLSLIPDLWSRLHAIAESRTEGVLKFGLDKAVVWRRMKVKSIIGVDVVLRSAADVVVPIPSQDQSFTGANAQERRNNYRRITHTATTGVTLLPPTQGSDPDQQWKPAPVVLSHAVLHNEGRSQDLADFAQSAHLGRIDPDGNWELQLSSTFDAVSGPVQLRDMLGFDPAGNRVREAELTLNNIVLLFRCVVRQ